MNINCLSAMTVSVGYADLLAKTLPHWLHGVTDCLVVTTPDDKQTQAVCRKLGVRYYETWSFYWRNAPFNKGWAMAEGCQLLNPQDWMLFFDADVAPPEGWFTALEECVPGKLYGAGRMEEDGTPINDQDIAGYFHLAHMTDPNMQVRPLVDTNWRHAGNYDSTFQDRWAAESRIKLPLTLTHYGKPGENWNGLGKSVLPIHKERQRLKGSWKHETIGNEVGQARFRYDWFTKNIPHIEQWLGGKSFDNGLEIGSFEGRSAYHWLNEGICKSLTCIDPWTPNWGGGSPELMVGAETAFDENVLRRWPDKVVKLKGHSQDFLPQLKLQGKEYGFIYVDGNHEAMWALTDLVMCWLMLAPGGLLLFDDYGWIDPGCHKMPHHAMDAFLTLFKPQIRRHRFSKQVGVQQVAVWKKS